ncbi:hypothetical protein GQ55_7G169000 [Panicum hallii var. hallii]|uniref:Uncharacterized protein n=1 Tax=Panicum hallii var. hallii TaxID=1504633 RepID=A0A2T7CVX8_9POAL|nr:hypothetical protein GQ55_7G169000 [Panicum hallii var. hallii]
MRSDIPDRRFPSLKTPPAAFRTLHKLTPCPLTTTEAVDFAALTLLLLPHPSLISSTVRTTRKQHPSKGRSSDRERGAEARSGGGGMDRNLSGLLIGCVGAAVTLLAYNQTVVTSTQCIAAGFVILLFALGVKEGIISL